MEICHPALAASAQRIESSMQVNDQGLEFAWLHLSFTELEEHIRVFPNNKRVPFAILPRI
jgi:hypothetical protein